METPGQLVRPTGSGPVRLIVYFNETVTYKSMVKVVGKPSGENPMYGLTRGPEETRCTWASDPDA